MLEETKVVNQVTQILKKQSYEIINKVPPSFTLRPEIYVKKGKRSIAFYYRQSNSIPEALVQRISSITRTKKNVECRIIFYRKPSNTTLRLLSTYGINAHLFKKNGLGNLLISSTKPTLKKVQKKKKRMPTIHIFISSHQSIEERNYSKEIIEDLSKSEKWPLFPICIEYDHRYNIKQTNRCESDNMEDSDWFIAILAEEYRKEVNKEVRRALKNLFKIDNIFIFVKSNKETKKSWKCLISYIEKNTNVKYLPYVDNREFKSVFLGKIMHHVKKLHKKLQIPFMGELLAIN